MSVVTLAELRYGVERLTDGQPPESALRNGCGRSSPLALRWAGCCRSTTASLTHGGRWWRGAKLQGAQWVPMDAIHRRDGRGHTASPSSPAMCRTLKHPSTPSSIPGRGTAAVFLNAGYDADNAGRRVLNSSHRACRRARHAAHAAETKSSPCGLQRSKCIESEEDWTGLALQVHHEACHPSDG